jgi:hypothetical protein
MTEIRDQGSVGLCGQQVAHGCILCTLYPDWRVAHAVTCDIDRYAD